ncbi:GAD-like domain-containing protein, partial [Inquilinus limosus]|uniref:GAD-like domain-containing protein n=1 Tax=Inquilinus limosus TaxID=171674 RepID=UPI001B7FCCC1
MADFPRSFQRALEKFGEPQGGEAVPTSVFRAYQGRLPDGLLRFWEQHGLGMWLDGYFQFCNPDVYHQVVQAILGNDPQLKADQSHLVGFSAFGHLLVRNEEHHLSDGAVGRPGGGAAGGARLYRQRRGRPRRAG